MSASPNISSAESPEKPHPLVVVLGPTASGKSALAIAIAQKFFGEVVICDSTQLYRQFDIGTGKLRSEDQGGIPHHLLDLLDPSEVFTAGDFREHALRTLEEIRKRDGLPVLTAGTGLYLRALLEGLADVPQRSEALRDSLRARSARRAPGHLHRILRRLDSEAATRIAPQDIPKLIRAIEVCMLAGKPISQLHRASRANLQGYTIIKLGLLPSRSSLYARIEKRVTEMLIAGWLEEVRSLIARGIPRDTKPFQFIGYSELAEHLEGRSTLDEAAIAIQQSTRRYAKRQITWFRKEANVNWFDGFGDEPRIIADAVEYVRQRLRSATHQYSAGSTSV